MSQAIEIHVEGTQRGFAVWAEQSGNCIHWQSFPVSLYAGKTETSEVYKRVQAYAVKLQAELCGAKCIECGRGPVVTDRLCLSCLGK